MAEPHATRATLIGDIVGSRRASNRAAIHRLLTETLAAENKRTTATSALRVTAGDEFQGAYASLGTALEVALRLRLILAGDIDIRIGVGWGQTAPLDQDGIEDGIEDGPGWWAARAAIDEVAALQVKAASRGLRTSLVCHEDSPRPEAPAIRAALQCQDHLLSLCDSRSQRILRGLMDGLTQLDIAAHEAVSAQAISSRVARDGLWVMAHAAAQLADLP